MSNSGEEARGRRGGLGRGSPRPAPLAKPAWPLFVLGSALGLGLGAVLAAAVGASAAAVLLVVLALVPWRRSGRLLLVGRALAAGSAALFVVVAVARVAGIAVFERGGLLGGSALIAALGGVLSVARVLALGTEAARRWADTAWAEARVEAFPADVAQVLLEALRASPDEEARAVDRAVAVLAAADPALVPSDPAARRALWINVYNVLAMHASRGRRSIRPWDILEVFRTRYSIAGLTLSPDGIEHGLLRDNAPHPAWKVRLLASGDPALRWAVPLDPRVHFALNCGAASCPLIRYYRGESLDEELEQAAEVFITGSTRVDSAPRVVETSKILDWYAGDFGGPAGVLRVVARHMGMGIDERELSSYRLVFTPYDWSAAFRKA